MSPRRDPAGPHAVVGTRLTALRVCRGLPREVLRSGARAGYVTPWRLEAGVKLPRIATLQRIAEAGGVSLDWLRRAEG